MLKNDKAFRQSDLPLIVRWWRGASLCFVPYATYQLFLLAAGWSTIDFDSLAPDGMARVIVVSTLLLLFVIVAPLVVHLVAFDIIAKPAIKSVLANTTPKPSSLAKLPRMSTEEESTKR